MRKRFGTSLLALLCFSAPAAAQEPPPDQSRAVATSPRLTLSGHFDTRYAHLAGPFLEARATLNAAPGSTDSATFLAASASLRLDFELDDATRAVFELERLAYHDGSNAPIGSDGLAPELDEAYIEIRRFLHDRLTLRLGQFDFSYRLRPHGEPFFFDADAESIWSGATAAAVRTTADRDQLASAGLRLQWSPAEIALVEFALVWRGETPLPAPPSDDELVAILFANAITGERNALFLLGALAAGTGKEDAIWTAGAGVDHYFGALRTIEAFAEVYGQFGRIGPGVTKRAWAGQLGARVVLESGLWGEAAAVYRSGDRRPTDGRDQSFQSAERVDRFLIVESAEFGFDWDTNVRALQLAFGAPLSARLSARLDAGWFWFNEDVPGALSDDDDSIGVEVDAGLTYELHAQARLHARAAVLFASDALEALTVDDDRRAWVLTAGCEVRF